MAMAAWCLPRDLADRFVKAVLDGTLDMERIGRMSSDERRAEFAKIIGDENAAMVNGQFEQKLLLKNQKAGLLRWANKLADVSEPARRDIVAQIGKLDRVLNPSEEQAFLSDLAAKKLGVTVTADEAKEIFSLSQRATRLRDEIIGRGTGDYRAGWTPESGTDFALAEKALLDKIQELKPKSSTWLHKLENGLALTRELETMPFHFSAPFVQGFGMVSRPQFWTGIGKMFQFFAKDEEFERYQAYMRGHPDWDTLKGGGLGLTKVGDKLSAREEDIQSSLLEGANRFLVGQMTKAGFVGVKNLMSGFSHAFTGYLNYLRFETATQLLTAARMRGEEITPISEATHDICQVVNNFTGRAEVGYRDASGHLAAPANIILYTVRKNVATFQIFNPWEYLKPNMSPTARMAAARQLIGMVVFTGAITQMAAMMGAKVNLNPIDSDFLKIDIGNEKFDLGGTNVAFIRFVARLVTGRAASGGGTPYEQNRMKTILNFGRGKLAPNVGILVDALVGKNAMDQPFSASQEMYDHMSPIVAHSLINYAVNNPDDTAAFLPALSTILGVGMESPDPPMSQSGRDVFGNPISGFGSPTSWRNDPVVQEARDLNMRLDFPPRKIRGVPLNDQQFDDYSRLSGRLAHARLEQVIDMPGWQNAPVTARKATMQHAIEKARESAARTIMFQSYGGSNDILTKSLAAKAALRIPGAAYAPVPTPAE